MATTTKEARIRRVKKAVRKRDGYKCVDCGLAEEEHICVHGSRLHVHRTTPNSEYTLEGCVTLCRDCHMKRHGNSPPARPQKRRSRERALDRGFTVKELARLVRVRRATILGWIARGELKAMHLASGTITKIKYIVLPEDWQAFVESRRVVPTPKRPPRRRKRTGIDYFP